MFIFHPEFILWSEYGLKELISCTLGIYVVLMFLEVSLIEVFLSVSKYLHCITSISLSLRNK